MVMFRLQISNGFTVLFGDNDDATIAVSILEHWKHFLEGADRWNRVSYFFPSRDSLGYNDGLFLYGVPYAFLRFTGFDPFLAAELVSILVRACGAYAYVFVARQYLGLSLGLSLLAAFLFNLSGNSLLEGNHAQLFTVSFLPIWLLLLGKSGCALWSILPQSGDAKRAGIRRGLLWGIAAAIFFDAWLLTAFYTAWLSGLFVALVSLIALSAIVASPVRSKALDFLGRRTILLSLAAILTSGALGAIPFLLVYLPKAAETGMHHFGNLRPSIPDLINLLNPHLDFGLWQGLRAQLGGRVMPGETDRFGYSALLLAPALLGCVAIFSDRAASPAVQRVWSSTAVATVLLAAAVTHPVLWRIIYDVVPGARALREPGRLLLVLSLPLTGLAMLGLAWLRRLGGRSLAMDRIALSVVVVLAAGLVVEELDVDGPVMLVRAAPLHLLRAVPRTPAGCAAFYVTGRSPELRGLDESSLEWLYRPNVDAMLIAAIRAVPTINGFSTFNPPDWNFAAVDRADYRDRVAAYVSRHRILRGLCWLDLDSHTWNTHPPLLRR